MKYICTLLLVSMIAQVSLAQNSIRPNIYMHDMQYYNPSSVEIDSNYRSQTSVYGKYKSVDNEAAIWNKPMNILLSHVGRIGSSHSFYTLSYVNDQYSFFNRNALYVGYVRQVKFGRSSTLSYSGRVVGNMDQVDWAKLKLPHDENGKSIYFNPDIDLGLNYQFKRFQLGVGFKNILQTATKKEGATLLKNKREINVYMRYRQNMGKQFAVTPFLLLAREPNIFVDAGLTFSLFNAVNASYVLRVNELKSVFVLDTKLTKNWRVGVSYDRSSLVSDHNIDFVVRYSR